MTTTMMNWFSPGVMQALGWALLHFLWQGTALAALAAAAMALCRRTSLRYIVGVTALALMLLAPLATFLVYQQHAFASVTAKSSPLAAVAWPIARDASAASGPTLSSRITPSLDAIPWLVEAWLLGVAFFSLRSAGGFFLLERERRRQSAVICARVLEVCYTLQAQLGIKRDVQFLECRWMQTPAVIGWFRPIVFLPVTALTGLSEEQLEMVIAHELAHIQRFDPFVNVFQVCVETLLFYHPAVWWLNQRIRTEREHCCDETAVALCGNAVEYARALTLMEEWRSAPVLAMAANRGPLTERIVRVLGLKTLGAGMRGIGLTGSLALSHCGIDCWRCAYRSRTSHVGAGEFQSAVCNERSACQLREGDISEQHKSETVSGARSRCQHDGRQGFFLYRRIEVGRSHRSEYRYAPRFEDPGRHAGICSRASGRRLAS